MGLCILARAVQVNTKPLHVPHRSHQVCSFRVCLAPPPSDPFVSLANTLKAMNRLHCFSRVIVALLLLSAFAAVRAASLDSISSSRSSSANGSGTLPVCSAETLPSEFGILGGCLECASPGIECPSGCCGQSALSSGGADDYRISPSNGQYIFCTPDFRCARVPGTESAGPILIMKWTTAIPIEQNGVACVGVLASDSELTPVCALAYGTDGERLICPDGISDPAISETFKSANSCHGFSAKPRTSAEEDSGSKADSSRSSNGGSNGGLVAGIVIAVLVVSALIAAAVFWFCCRPSGDVREENGINCADKDVELFEGGRDSYNGGGIYSNSAAPGMASAPFSAASPQRCTGIGNNAAPPSYATSARRSRGLASLFSRSPDSMGRSLAEPVSANQQDAASWSPQPVSVSSLSDFPGRSYQSTDPPLPLVYVHSTTPSRSQSQLHVPSMDQETADIFGTVAQHNY
jgi:hypothetical protein